MYKILFYSQKLIYINGKGEGELKNKFSGKKSPSTSLLLV